MIGIMIFLHVILGLKDIYKFEFITDINIANKRLDHNSYDVLVIEDAFIKNNSINLFKKAYAMSRPTIILCNSYYRYFYYTFWKHFSKWSNKFKISKEMIFITYTNNISILDDIPFLHSCQLNLSRISSEISSIVF